MLSPAGVHSKPDDFNLDREIDSFPAERRLPKFAYKLTPLVWSLKISPFQFLRASGSPLVKISLVKYVKKRVRSENFDPHVLEDYQAYLHQSLLRDASTE